MPPGDTELPDLEEKTRFLLAPDSYPEATTAVRLQETHMARVFLTDQFVYKMKKPVRFSFLDFSSLDRRYGVCCEELRLNRRLTDDIYLNVVPLRLAAAGELSLGEVGTPVEWLVKMRRLQQEDCLTQQIERVTAESLMPLLQRLQGFYRAAVPLPITGAQYRARMRQRIDSVRAGLRTPALGLDAAEIDGLAASLDDFTRTRSRLIDKRIARSPIIEGHGDLRPEHCFLTSPPQIIDCLEFNRDLRCVDPLDELCYLALECELLGRTDLGATIVDSYSDDGAPDPALVHFYQCYRALLRAQLAAAHLLDAEVPNPDKWYRKTRIYLDAAGRHRDRLSDTQTNN
ncbi:hypothetical protein [uncultured Microbulbifer sp.]|uniref:hypothetical protein n=1 Tax=uncultured Microbulbifer sp. TaxID=348147 RepID=UPI0025D264A1|nr:hypothetical protein [uncultured Microbulbifer sp.]